MSKSTPHYDSMKDLQMFMILSFNVGDEFTRDVDQELHNGLVFDSK